MMKLRFAQPGHLIDLGRIAELKGIREDGGTIVIGAMTTENELIWSKLLQEKCPLLVEGARLISDPQVRYKGTIGGDIAHGDPGNDHPALMLALGASFVLRAGRASASCRPTASSSAPTTTLLKPDEIMTEIRMPDPGAGHRLVLRQAEAQGRRFRDRGRRGHAAHEGRHGADSRSR